MMTQENNYSIELTEIQLVCLIRVIQEKCNQSNCIVRDFQVRLKESRLLSKNYLDDVASEINEWKALNEALTKLIEFHSNPEEKAEASRICESQLSAANEMLGGFKKLYEYLSTRTLD